MDKTCSVVLCCGWGDPSPNPSDPSCCNSLAPKGEKLTPEHRYGRQTSTQGLLSVGEQGKGLLPMVGVRWAPLSSVWLTTLDPSLISSFGGHYPRWSLGEAKQRGLLGKGQQYLVMPLSEWLCGCSPEPAISGFFFRLLSLSWPA